MKKTKHNDFVGAAAGGEGDFTAGGDAQRSAAPGGSDPGGPGGRAFAAGGGGTLGASRCPATTNSKRGRWKAWWRRWRRVPRGSSPPWKTA